MVAKHTWDKDGNMTSDDSDSLKGEIHVCTKESVLAQITTGITGIHEDITEIKGNVKEVNGQYIELLVEVTKISGSLDAFKKEVAATVAASDKGFSKTIKILGIIIAVIMMFFAYRNLTTKIDNTETVLTKRIDQQEGISKVTRSGYVKYNDQGLSDSIRVK